MSAHAPAYPASTLAKLFHLTERRVQQLAKAGIIFKNAQGKYDLVSSVQGYVKYLQDRALGRSEGAYTDAADIKVERKRLIKAQADRAETENQQQRGALVALSVVTAVFHALAILYASSIEALPGRLAHELAGLHDPAEIKQRLFTECREIRCSTADQLRRWAKALAGGERNSGDGQCAEGEDT
jgi:phage terminase Nu1 subunit (DNA packaging protein)